MDAPNVFIIIIHLNMLFAGSCIRALYFNGDLLVSIWTDACGLVVFRAVHVRAVVKGTVPPSYGSPSSLVEKMPVKASKGSVLRALVLEEQRALLCPELLQVAEKQREEETDKWSR